MLKRYIVSTTGRSAYITKFYINLFDNVLRFGYNIYQIKNTGISSMIERINDSFRSNPESDSVFNKLPVEQVFSHTISQLESTDIITEIEKVLANPKGYTSNNSHFKITLPYATLYYELEKVKLLYNFIKHFYENYELIKLELSKPKENISDNSDLSKTEVSVNTNSIDSLSSKIFNEFVKQSPSNILTFFILKSLTAFYNDHNVSFNYNSENGELLITISEFTSNYMLFYSDLNTLINYNANTENYDAETFRKSIRTKINSLIKILVYIFENSNKLNKEELYLYTHIIIIFIYVYGHWFNNNTGSSDIYKFTNSVIKNLFNTTNKYKIIKFINNSISKSSDLKLLDISKINELSVKYNYLIHIDSSLYIKNIITDYQKDNDIKNESSRKILDRISNRLILNKPKLLDLSNLIDNPPLKYKIISSNTDHIVITKAYQDFLFVLNSNNVLPNYEFDNHLPKLFDVISNKIVPNINKFNEMVKLNASTLFIYTNFIEPYINNELISVEEKLYLVYDIVLPYVYDTFKIDKFIDYFH